MAQIVGIGGIVYDFVCHVNEMPRRGESVFATDMKVNYGGKSANSVVQAALLGNVTTAMVGKVGADTYGQEQILDMKKYGVNADNIKINPNLPSSKAFITIDKTGNNQIVLALGADKSVSIEDIEECATLIADAKVLICNYEVPVSVCNKAFDIATLGNTKTILVPAPIPHDFTLNMMTKVDVICLNEIEAGQLIGMRIDNQDAAELAIRKFYEIKGDKIRWPIITLGEKGVVFGIEPGNVKRIPAPKVKVVDTTGAGDSFVGCLAHSLAHDFNIEEAVLKSVFVASHSTTRHGTRCSYITQEEYEAMF